MRVPPMIPLLTLDLPELLARCIVACGIGSTAWLLVRRVWR